MSHQQDTTQEAKTAPVVVITGASSGFGKGVARRLASQAAKLVLAARRTPLLEELARECELAGGEAIALEVDVGRREDMEHLSATAKLKFGGFDVWINNAGVGAVGRFDEVPVADHVKLIETNLIGVVYGSHHALRHFHQKGKGVLINVASIVGKIPAPYYASYTASKYGIVGLSASLRQELRENNMENIHVCTVMPMAMDTPFFEHAANYSGHEVVPIPPLYDPERVIETIIELISEPEDEVIVGTQGKVMAAAHGVAQGMVEKMMGRNAHSEQMEKAPPAPDSAGSLHQPVYEGTEVYGERLAGKS